MVLSIQQAHAVTMYGVQIPTPAIGSAIPGVDSSEMIVVPSLYVGGDAATHDIVVEIAPGVPPLTEPTAAQWVDISDDVRFKDGAGAAGVTISRGRSRDMGRFEAGRAAFSVNNAGRHYEAQNPASKFAVPEDCEYVFRFNDATTAAPGADGDSIWIYEDSGCYIQGPSTKQVHSGVGVVDQRLDLVCDDITADGWGPYKTDGMRWLLSSNGSIVVYVVTDAATRSHTVAVGRANGVRIQLRSTWDNTTGTLTTYTRTDIKDLEDDTGWTEVKSDSWPGETISTTSGRQYSSTSVTNADFHTFRFLSWDNGEKWVGFDPKDLPAYTPQGNGNNYTDSWTGLTCTVYESGGGSGPLRLPHSRPAPTNDGTATLDLISNRPTYADSQDGKAFQITNIGQELVWSPDQHFGGTGDVTIAFWIKGDPIREGEADQSRAPLFGWGDPALLWPGNDSTAYVQATSTTPTWLTGHHDWRIDIGFENNDWTQTSTTIGAAMGRPWLYLWSTLATWGWYAYGDGATPFDGFEGDGNKWPRGPRLQVRGTGDPVGDAMAVWWRPYTGLDLRDDTGWISGSGGDTFDGAGSWVTTAYTSYPMGYTTSAYTFTGKIYRSLHTEGSDPSAAYDPVMGAWAGDLPTSANVGGNLAAIDTYNGLALTRVHQQADPVRWADDEPHMLITQDPTSGSEKLVTRIMPKNAEQGIVYPAEDSGIEVLRTSTNLSTETDGVWDWRIDFSPTTWTPAVNTKYWMGTVFYVGFTTSGVLYVWTRHADGTTQATSAFSGHGSPSRIQVRGVADYNKGTLDMYYRANESGLIDLDDDDGWTNANVQVTFTDTDSYADSAKQQWGWTASAGVADGTLWRSTIHRNGELVVELDPRRASSNTYTVSSTTWSHDGTASHIEYSQGVPNLVWQDPTPVEVTTTAAVLDGTWHHVAISTYLDDDGDRQLETWVDGVSEGTTQLYSDSSVSMQLDRYMRLGYPYLRAGETTEWLVDDLCVADRKFTDDEIATLATAGVQLTPGSGLQPRTHVRVRASMGVDGGFTTDLVDRFRGYISQVKPRYPGQVGAGAVSDVTAHDLFSVLAGIELTTAAGAAAESYSVDVLADSPLAYWDLTETSGTTADDQGSGANDATIPSSGPATAPSVRSSWSDTWPSASDETVSFTVPAGTTDGDYMLMGVALPGYQTIPTPPTGWTQIASAKTGTGVRDLCAIIFERVASSEPASYSVTRDNGDYGWGGCIVSVQNPSATTPKRWVTSANNGVTSSPKATGGTATNDDLMVALYLAEHLYTTSRTPPAGWTEELDDSDATVTSDTRKALQVSYKTSTGGAEADATAAASHTCDHCSFMVAVAVGDGGSGLTLADDGWSTDTTRKHPLFDTNGVDVTAAAFDTLTGALTLECWMRVSSVSGTGTDEHVLIEIADRASGDDSITAGLRMMPDGTLKWRHADVGLSMSTGSDPDLSDGSWHHVAVTRTSGLDVTAYIDGAQTSVGTVDGSATTPWSGGTGQLGIGEVVGVGHSGTQFDGWIGDVAVYSTALPAGRIASHAGNDQFSAAPGESTSSRLEWVLTAAGVPTDWWDHDTGIHTVKAEGTQTSALALAQAANDAERGQWYISRSGKSKFENRDARLARFASGPITTFGDLATEEDMADMSLDYSDERVVNEAVVTLSGADTTATASDATSKATYGTKRFSLTVDLDSEGIATSIAEAIVQTHADPDLVLDGLRVLAANNSTRLALMSAVDVSTPLCVNWRPDGNEPISLDAFVESVTEELTPLMWTTSMRCSPASQQAGWVLDVSELGVTTRLNY